MKWRPSRLGITISFVRNVIVPGHKVENLSMLYASQYSDLYSDIHHVMS